MVCHYPRSVQILSASSQSLVERDLSKGSTVIACAVFGKILSGKLLVAD